MSANEGEFLGAALLSTGDVGSRSIRMMEPRDVSSLVRMVAAGMFNVMISWDTVASM